MTRRHEAAVTAMVPTARSRTFLAGEVARLGAGVGPVGDGGVVAWVGAMDAARGGHFTTGRVADEVPDPYGESLESYRRCADRLDGICTTLARLLVPRA
jgi:protein-tyrosine-phosphatase